MTLVGADFWRGGGGDAGDAEALPDFLAGDDDEVIEADEDASDLIAAE